MSSLLSGALADRRFTMLLLVLFGAVALVLTAVGIYGVVSYSVAQRTREIGIRIAIGAEPRRVARMVQRQALTVVGVGVVMGIAGAFALTRVMDSLLYDVGATDPLSFGVVAVALLLTAWAASWFPARRGTRIDPVGRSGRSEGRPWAMGPVRQARRSVSGFSRSLPLIGYSVR